ncbi:MAG: serine/threonine-protein kinase [Myxococcota bacterium]
MLDISIPGHEVLHLVGEGGMAQVWAGARLGAGGSLKPVAIKRIRPQLFSDPRFREMFLVEGRTTMLFGHGNIVNVFDVGSSGNELYMVMEWVDGVTLDQFAHALLTKRNEPLELSLVISIVTQLLCALDYAHEFKYDKKKMGIIHRDVSPFNVMVTSSGEIKLMDFGVARVSGVHTTRSFKGNLCYMPKEQAQGDPRVESDLYAVGGILYRLLEGKGFRSQHGSEEALLQAIYDGTVPTMKRPDVPDGLRRLVYELLAPDWRHRPHSAAEAIKRLERLGIEQYTSTLPIKGLYRTFFGDSRSRLTWVAHRNPEMWIEHMRRQGQAAAAHRDAQPAQQPAPPRPPPPNEVRPTQTARPYTKVRPRMHEAAAIHRAGEFGDVPFDEAKTVCFRSGGRRDEVGDDATFSGPRKDLPDDAPRTTGGTVRLSMDYPNAADVGAPVVDPTVRLTPAECLGADNDEPLPEGGAEAGVPGVFTRLGWVSRTFGGRTVQGVARWRELATGPLGLLLLSCFTFGVVLPLACDLGYTGAAEARQ